MSTTIISTFNAAQHIQCKFDCKMWRRKIEMNQRPHVLDVVAKHISCVQIKTILIPPDRCVAASEVRATWIHTIQSRACRRVHRARLTQRLSYNLRANLARKSDPRTASSDGSHQPRPPPGQASGPLGPVCDVDAVPSCSLVS